MKKTQDNICKFVQPIESKSIKTVNFVYETNHNLFDKMRLKQEHTMNLVISGNGKLVTENWKYEITAGTLFFTMAGVHFKIENECDLKYMYITFSGERAEELFKRFSITPLNCVFAGNKGLASFWQNAIVRANKKNLDLISEGVLLYSFSQLVQIEKNDEQRLTDTVLSYIDLNFTDFGLTLSKISGALGYNAKYISRVFKKSTGMTFSEYLKHIRINHAIFLMGQGITSVKNVALLSGYNDPLYFSNVFKKELGISASEYISSLSICVSGEIKSGKC